ncbi:MAG: hypothetical protein ABI684_07395 [Nitrospirota bacterium]
MEYVGILDVPPLRFVLLSIVQTFTLFVAVLLGLKVVGRRVFGEKGPQDLVILVLIAEAASSGLNHQGAGYWGSAASVMTILLLGWLSEKTKVIRQFIEGRPVFLYDAEPLTGPLWRSIWSMKQTWTLLQGNTVLLPIMTSPLLYLREMEP